MSVNSVSSTSSSAYSAYTARETSSSTGSTTSAAQTDAGTEAGAVYEKSASVSGSKTTYSVNKMSSEDRAALVQQLKADQESRQQSFMGIVQKTLGQQANVSNLSSLFSPENLKKVDAATIAQAKEDVSEDGYYGVKKTSQRLFDFASALAGDDVDKMKEMQQAMQKGFDKATKAWGKTLPQISQDTLAAANQLFEDYYKSKSAE
jgi:hypothetical protein